MRVLPHKQDTGGFFIAALEKTREMPWVTPKATHNDETADQPARDDTVKPASQTDEKSEGSNEAEKVESEKDGAVESAHADDSVQPGDKRKGEWTE